MIRPKLTHEQHVELAKQIVDANNKLRNAFFDVVQPAFGKSHPTSRALYKVITKYMINVRRTLDTEYHKVTSTEQFIKEGHVYYKDPE